MAVSHLPKAKVATQTFIQRSRSVSAEEKATFHTVTGAGRSRVKRDFFDLNDDDVDVLTRVLEDGIDRRMAGEG
jgi:hypothetical protein